MNLVNRLNHIGTGSIPYIYVHIVSYHRVCIIYKYIDVYSVQLGYKMVHMCNWMVLTRSYPLRRDSNRMHPRGRHKELPSEW